MSRGNVSSLKFGYVLNKDIPGVYFRGWVDSKDEEVRIPILSEKLHEAKFWKEKTNCRRFLKRNQKELVGFECVRIIAKRYCANCGMEMDPEMQVSAKFCCDKCRVDNYKALH